MIRIAIGVLVVCVGLGIGLAGGYYWRSSPSVQVTSTEPTQRESTAAAKRLRDESATGKPNISATWSALDNVAYPTECGITPTDRYYVTQNGIGKTVHDEPSDDEWAQIGCERTSPVHQAEILHRPKSYASNALLPERTARQQK